MEKKQGSLSIDSENIFPIIKKWLYSDHDIFYREMISNCCDAITKRQKLDVMGECELPDGYVPRVEVELDGDEKTITFTDNGIGMTFDEVDEYINQIAFSGAQAFLEKYKDKTSDDQIIGHFGLGFYSAFMVADRVSIDTLSCLPGSEPVYWESDGGVSYEMEAGDRTEPGTSVTLYLNEDSYEFSNEYRAKEVLTKYCSFMPWEIWVKKAGEEPKEGEEEKPLNDTHPLWTRHPNDCSEEDYKTFYRDVFHDYKEPLFWIHLNMDYPFNLKGILYFPKINSEFDSIEGTIKLYNNQVFIADNIKEVIPEFLMLLKGVIDCPDLPLNVSRSALQNDGFVKKISDYITKKVADKLTGMYKTEKEAYEKVWDDIAPFVKYGAMKDETFFERVKDCILFKNLSDEYYTLDECLEAVKDTHENVLFYVSDPIEQGSYIEYFRSQGLDAVYLRHNIDTHFITLLEQKHPGLAFKRIDAEISDSLKEKAAEEETEDEKTAREEAKKAQEESLTELFKKVLGREEFSLSLEKLKDRDLASMVTVSEQGRRIQEMFRSYNFTEDTSGLFSDESTLVLNENHPLVQYLLENPEGELTEDVAHQLYDLAHLSHHSLSAEEMQAFVARTNKILSARVGLTEE